MKRLFAVLLCMLALTLSGLSLIHIYPERSRFSGVVKDLRLNWPNA